MKAKVASVTTNRMILIHENFELQVSHLYDVQKRNIGKELTMRFIYRKNKSLNNLNKYKLYE